MSDTLQQHRLANETQKLEEMKRVMYCDTLQQHRLANETLVTLLTHHQYKATLYNNIA